jgi:ketosteroid isomerase-like protein
LELSDEKDAIHQVVSGYYDAFARDPATAAAFYGEPTLFVLPNEVLALPTRSNVEAFLAKLLESLKSLGYSRTKLDVPRVKMLNSTTALYSTVAIRLKTDGTELQRAGFTYLLHKGGAGWKINEVIATDVDKLISAD